MSSVTSADGTTIAFDRSGEGPALIIVLGGPTDRSVNAPLADLLARHFTVFNYDRRRHGVERRHASLRCRPGIRRPARHPCCRRRLSVPLRHLQRRRGRT
jgi:hypothetical protein